MRRIFYWVVLLLLVFLSIEGMSFFFLRAKSFPETMLDPEVKNTLSGANLINTWNRGNAGSPFFGYVLRAGTGVNNFGFIDDHEFPVKKKATDFVIGVFGGSVADSFITNKSRFIDRLREKVHVLKDKNVILVNLALGGYKQPQQFFIMCYFLEMFDLVIQLDGWNESYIVTPAGIPLNFPLFSETFYNRNPEDHIRLQKAQELNEKSIQMEEFIQRQPLLKHSYTMKAVAQIIQTIAHQRLHDLVADLKTSKNSIFSEQKQNLPKEEEAQVRADNWRKYLELEGEIAKSRNLPIFFFIQPSQYVHEGKPFTFHERESAVGKIVEKPEELAYYDFKNMIRGVSILAFEKIRASAQQLRKRGHNVIDLGALFKNENREIYVDKCCHINKLGNEILSERIIEELSSYLDHRKSDLPPRRGLQN